MQGPEVHGGEGPSAKGGDTDVGSGPSHWRVGEERKDLKQGCLGGPGARRLLFTEDPLGLLTLCPVQELPPKRSNTVAASEENRCCCTFHKRALLVGDVLKARPHFWLSQHLAPINRR